MKGGKDRMSKREGREVSSNLGQVIRLIEGLSPQEKNLLKSVIREEDKDWERRFDEILAKIRAKTQDYSYEEIQAIVNEVVEEVRRVEGC
jgi:hypothetical protein